MEYEESVGRETHLKSRLEDITIQCSNEKGLLISWEVAATELAEWNNVELPERYIHSQFRVSTS
jgi:hypothetical protein